ncbi:MAG: amidohydrolase [Promethearchaeota archaeon]
MTVRIDLVVSNANILTLEQEQPVAEAMAVSSGRILGIGDNEELAGLARMAQQVLDLRGRTVVPGFIDSHAHLEGLGRRLLNLDLGDATSAEDALSKVRAYVTRIPPGKAVLGFNWDESSWPVRRYLTRRDLDPVAPNNPVVLSRVCGHLYSVNTLALNQLDIDFSHPGVDRDLQTGELTGVLRDVPIDTRPLRSLGEESLLAIRAGSQCAVNLGITSVHENLSRTQLHCLASYLRLWRAGELPIRTYCNLDKDLLAPVVKLGLLSGVGDHIFRIGGVKVFVDGAIGARTAALTQPYPDDSTNSGFFEMTEDEYSSIVETANKLGQQVSTHAIGDAAIALVLRCQERVSGKEVIKRLRHNIIHAEYLTESLLKHVKELDMLLLMQPNFAHRWGLPGGMYDERLGVDRAQQLNNLRRILDTGVRVAFGSDCMPMDPIYGLYSAVVHPNPAIRITVKEALQCYTLDSAYASFEERDKGSLAPGKLADFVVLSENPLSVAPDALGKIKVEQTYVGGTLVSSKG